MGLFTGFLGGITLLTGWVAGLDNGLARTPPMGWMSWERFRCNTDCEGDPEFCIGENLFKQMGDMLVVGGYKDVGYNTVIIDDCWLDHKRSSDGKLQPDSARFPGGVKGVSDYLHKLGLKFGLYEDYGNFTCGGYPGVLGHMETDAQSFADWGVDYIKLDGCYADSSTYETGYPQFGAYMNATGRPMVYSCSWPAYQIGENPNYPAIVKHCNLWRNFDDISDSWESVLSILDYYGEDKDGFGTMAGPGHWNDPDMLIIGNYGLSLSQSWAQMGMWCMLAAPLIMSADLRTIRPEFRNILTHGELIKLNQDPLGVQARRIVTEKNIHVYSRPVMPLYKDKTSVAVAFLNRWTEGTPLQVKFTLSSMGLDHPSGYQAINVITGDNLGSYSPASSFTGSVDPTGILVVKFVVLPHARGMYYGAKDGAKDEAKDGATPFFTENDFQVIYPGLSGWRKEL